VLTFVLEVAYSVTMTKPRDHIMTKVFASYGNATQLAAYLGVSKQAVSQWKRIPLRYLKMISEETGLSRRKLRPDLYD
jgi:DNA-binding transcriptional regulator YdaS (Cro superfamily)